MGFKEISFTLPTDYGEDLLRRKIRDELRVKDFSYQVESKSLDARKKTNIHWLVRVSVLSKEIPGPAREPFPVLEIPFKKDRGRAVVVGSGPAGFFSALVLQKAGFETTIVERGAEVQKRAQGILDFERTGVFSPTSNYSFGEGGAGTFSDGKLTSRTKNISKEKQFMLSSYIRGGRQMKSNTSLILILGVIN